MTLVAFDLDGVLVDSVQVVRDAYRWAGVVDVPMNIFELEGVDWIAAQLESSHARPALVASIRREKAARYLLMIGKAKLLPPYWVAYRLRRAGHTCVILSGAPVGTIDQVRRRHAWTWPFAAGLDGLRTPAKLVALQSMARDLGPYESPAYVDDQSVLPPIPWRFVRYDGQTEEELMRGIMG